MENESLEWEIPGRRGRRNLTVVVNWQDRKATTQTRDCLGHLVSGAVLVSWRMPNESTAVQCDIGPRDLLSRHNAKMRNTWSIITSGRLCRDHVDCLWSLWSVHFSLQSQE